jgi:hypothetical protein
MFYTGARKFAKLSQRSSLLLHINSTMRSFIIYTLHQILLGWSNQRGWGGERVAPIGKVKKVKLSLCTTPWRRIREWRYSSTHSLTSALDGGEWSASCPGSFTPRERAPGTHWIGGWVGPRAVLCKRRWREKFTAPAGNRKLEPRSSSPYPSAIPTELSRIGEMRNIYNILIGKPDGKRPLWRPSRRWENNTRV